VSFSGPSEDQAKLHFRKSLSRCATQVIAPEDAFWSQFWLVPDAASELTGLLPIEVLRNALAQKPENISTLISVLCAHLFQLVADPRWAAEAEAARKSSASAARYFTTATSATPSTSLAGQALNCVRVLSRVLPIVHERVADSRHDEEKTLFHDLFWSPRKHIANSSPVAERDQLVIDDEDEEVQEPMHQSKGLAESQTCLGQQLLVRNDCLVTAALLIGFLV